MGYLFKYALADNKFLVLADQSIYSGRSFITTILMARILIPSDFGIYASIILFVYLVTSIINAIVIQPLQVTIGGINNKQSYISFTFWIQLGLVLFICLLLAIILSQNFAIFNLYNNLITGIIIITAGHLAHDYFRKILLAKVDIIKVLIIDIIMAIIHIVFLIYAFFFSKFELVELILYLGLGYVPMIMVSINFIKPRINDITTWQYYLSSHYHQSKWLLMTAFVQWWSGNLFAVASGALLGIRALGAFRLVQSIFGVMNAFSQIIENYALPKTSRLLFNSYYEAKYYLKQISIKSFLLLGSTLFLVFIFSKSIIVLAGGIHYSEYAYFVKGMAILYFIIFLGYPIRMAIRVLILNKDFFLGYLFSLIFNLISFNYLLEKWNLMGAIIGLIISQIIVLSYWQHILIKNNFVLWK